MKQISTFLYCLGEEAESVLASTNVTDADHRDFDRIIAKVERARFNRRNQQSGETAEQYIMALYALAKHCDYGWMTDEMIRDRLVVGIRDSALSEKLQMDATLTLESAKKAIRQREAFHEQQQTLKAGDRTTVDVDAVQPKSRRQNERRGNTYNTRASTQPHPNNSQTGEECSRCGRERHPRDKCPARDAQCHNCKRKGHFRAQCHQRVVSTIQDTDSAFLDTLSSGKTNIWIAHIAINGSS